jgi:hypothetical protein
MKTGRHDLVTACSRKHLERAEVQFKEAVQLRQQPRLPATEAGMIWAEILDAIYTGAGVIFYLLGDGKFTPDNGSDLSAISVIPETSISVCIGGRGDDLDEVIPVAYLASLIDIFTFLMVGFPGAGADVGIETIVAIEQAIPIAVDVGQPGVVPFHD